MKQIIEEEVRIINKLFKHQGVMAKTVKPNNVLNSFVRYDLILHSSASFTTVEKMIRELAVIINNHRQKHNLPTTEVIPVTSPAFALEVAHPCPQPLLWPMRKATSQQPHTALCGLSAIDNRVEVIKLDETPHTLIAGITGAGKSVLLQMMLLSLCAGTSPNDLQLVLVDLKNEDLVPFKSLPHVLRFAGNHKQAVEAIQWVVDEKNRRIEQGITTGPRIVLVIDELAHVADDKAVRTSLGQLASIGRSKKINLIAATQSVTKDGGIGSMMKANFTCRLIGKVAPGLSAIATSLPQMHADKLPGKGAFLRIEGSNNHRFQSYLITPDDVNLMVKYITDQWKKAGYGVVAQPVITSYEAGYERLHTSKNDAQQTTSYNHLFPIKTLRELTSAEITEIKRLAMLPDFQYQGKPSINKLVLHVFGSKDPLRVNAIKSALENNSSNSDKIIKLKKMG